MKTKPARKPIKADPNALGTRRREVIRSRDLTASAVARDAGIDPGMVQRFLTGQRDLRLESASKICAALGIRLVEGGRGRSKSSLPITDQTPGDPVPGSGAALEV